MNRTNEQIKPQRAATRECGKGLQKKSQTRTITLEWPAVNTIVGFLTLVLLNKLRCHAHF